MKVYLKYKVPSLYNETHLSVCVIVRHGLIKDISFDWDKSLYVFSLSSPYPVLNVNHGFVFFNFYYTLLLKEVLKDTEDARLSNNLNLLNILNDYFIILEIMDQINKTAFFYDDKRLYTASDKFFRNNTFHEKLLKKISGIIESRGIKGLKELLTLKDVFFLYDLLMDYMREKEKEGGWYNNINTFMFSHFYRDISIFEGNYYQKEYLGNKKFIPSNIPDYRNKLLQDQNLYLSKMKNDLENFSKTSYDSLFEHFELPVEPNFMIEKDDMFMYGKIQKVTDDHIDINYIYDIFHKRKESFINLHHETLDYIFSLFHFELKEKFYV